MRKARRVNKMDKQQNLPQKKFRAGAISVTIWENAAKKDGIDTSYNTISIERAYKDKNNAWQTTSSLRINDLPKVALMLEKAYESLILSDKTSEAM